MTKGSMRPRTLKYRSHIITGVPKFYHSYAMGEDIEGKSVAEVKRKIDRLESGHPNPAGEGISQFCCTQPHADGCRHCAPKALLAEGKLDERMSWMRRHYRKYHPKLFSKQVKKGVASRKAKRQNELVKVTVPWYKKPLLGVLNPIINNPRNGELNIGLSYYEERQWIPAIKRHGSSIMNKSLLSKKQKEVLDQASQKEIWEKNPNYRTAYVLYHKWIDSSGYEYSQKVVKGNMPYINRWAREHHLILKKTDNVFGGYFLSPDGSWYEVSVV